MKYLKKIKLKDGRECILRNGEEHDGQAVLANFILTHEQTDYLLSYPDENTMTAEQEAEFLKAKTESSNEIEILAETVFVDNVIWSFVVSHIFYLIISNFANFRSKVRVPLSSKLTIILVSLPVTLISVISPKPKRM